MTVEELYNTIGQRVLDSIDESWQMASLSIKRLDKFVSVKASYKNSTGDIRDMKSSNFGYAFSKVVHELHKITTEGNSKWNKLEYIMYPDSKFHIDFIWDQEYQNEIDSLNNEIRKEPEI